MRLLAWVAVYVGSRLVMTLFVFRWRYNRRSRLQPTRGRALAHRNTKQAGHNRGSSQPRRAPLSCCCPHSRCRPTRRRRAAPPQLRRRPHAWRRRPPRRLLLRDAQLPAGCHLVVAAAAPDGGHAPRLDKAMQEAQHAGRRRRPELGRRVVRVELDQVDLARQRALWIEAGSRIRIRIVI